MWISHCYKFPPYPSKQSIDNHLWVIPSWWPGKTVPFQLPPRLGDTITLFYLPVHGQNQTEIELQHGFALVGYKSWGSLYHQEQWVIYLLLLFGAL